MPTNIDQEVLQMKFDNSQFKKGITDTLNALKDFKSKLTFKESIQSVEQLSAATKSFSMQTMANNVETISNRFSTLGIIGMTALQNIANQAVNTGTRMISALTIDPIKMGFNEYELKMGSIQTIMAATGESLETVNGYLDELNAYSDQTIYSFSDMTSNIGKFTNAGVKLEDAVLAIKGISNEAAVSGANANEASRAMYNFAQALSAGSVKLIDWKSIELANMGTVEFKQQLLDTAVALGTVVEEQGKYRSVTTDANGKVSDLFTTTTAFNESLSSQWMTTDVLIQTLKRYADETTDIGSKAYRSAQEIKTISMLWDTWKESVQSGWGMTFQYIIGDFEEAKALLTEVNNAFGPILDAMADARNIPLGIWHDLGGRVALIDSLRNILSSIGSILGAIGKAFNNVFNDNVGQILYDMTINFKNFTERLIVGDETLGKIEKTFTGVFQIIRAVGGAVAWLAGNLISLGANIGLEAFKFVGEFFLNIGSALADAVTGIREFVSYIAGLDTIRSIFERLNSIRKALVKGFKNLFNVISKFTLNKQVRIFDAFRKALEKILSVVKTVIDAVDSAIQSFLEWTESGEAAKIIMDAFAAASNILSNALDALWSAVEKVANVISSNFGPAIRSIVSFISNIIESIKEFVKALLEIPEVQQFIEDLKNGIKSLGEMIKNGAINAMNAVGDFFNMIMNFNPATALEGIRQLSTNIQEAGVTAQSKASGGIESFLTVVKDKLSQAVQTGGDAVGFFTTKYKTFQDFIGSFVEKIDVGAIAAAGLTGGMTLLLLNIATTVKKVGDQLTSFLKIGTALTDCVKNLGNVFTQIGEVFKARALAVKMEAVGTLLLKIAGAVAILALSIGALTLVDQEKLKTSAITLGLFAGGLIALIGVLGILDRVFKAGDVEKYAALLFALSVSLAVITGALVALGEVNMDGLWEKVAVIGTLIGILGAVVIAIQKFSKIVGPGEVSVATSAGSLLAIAGSLLIMVGAVKLLAGTDDRELVKAVGVIGLLGLILTGISYLSGKITPGAEWTMLAVAAALGVMAFVIKQYSGISTDALVASLPALIVVLGLFGLLMRASASAGQYAIQGGVGLLAISAAMLIMGEVIKRLADISKDQISQAMNSIAAITLVFGLLMAATRLAGANALQAGAGIFAISASMVVLAGAIMILSQLSEEDLQKSTGVVLALGAMFAVLINSTKNAKGLEKTLISMTAAIAVLVGSVVALTLIDPSKLFAATEAMVVLMLSLSALVASTGKAKSAYGQLAFMLVVVAALAAVVYALKDVNAESAIGSATAIGILLLTLTASLTCLDGVKDINKGALIGLAALTLVVGALGAILYLLQGMNPDSVIPIAASLSILLISMTVCCAVLSALNVQVAPAAQGALALIAFIGILGIFMGAIGALVTYFPQLEEFLYRGLPLLRAIGEGIGGFLGGIIGGAIDAAGDSLPGLATDLSNFATNLEPFISAMNGIPDNFGQKVGQIGQALALIGTGTFLNALSNIGNVGSLFGGDSSLVSFGKDLEEFAACLTSFANKCSEVNTGAISNVIPAIDTLTTCCAKLNPSGPLSFLFGENNFTSFAQSLEGLGNGLKTFGENVEGVQGHTEAVNAAVEMIKKLGEAQGFISEGGGFVQAICGWKNYDTFATGLDKLGAGISAFATAVVNVSPDSIANVDAAVQIIKKLGEAQEYIDPSGGWMQAIIGTKDFGNFGSSLEALGEGVANFANQVKGVADVASSVDIAVQTIQRLGEIQGLLNTTGGLFTGTNTYSNFTTAAWNLGEGIANIASKLSEVTIDLSKMDGMVQTINKLQEVHASLGTIDPFSMIWKIEQLKIFVDKFNMIPPASSEIASGIITIGNALRELSLLISASGSSFYTSSFTSANKIGEGFGAGIAASTEVINGTLTTLMTAALQIVTDSIILFETAAQDLVNRFCNAFVQAMNTGGGLIRDAVHTVLKSAVSVARSYYGEFSRAGSHLAYGLAAGIRNNSSVVTSAASQVAFDAYVSAKNALEIKSPSKKFMYLGRMSVAGFVNGFRNNVGTVKMEAEKTAQASLTAFRDAVSGYGSVKTLLEADADPMITPVVDLSNVKAAATTIDGMLIPTRSLALSAGVMQDVSRRSKVDADRSSDKGVTNNYYLDGINVTQENNGNFMEEMIDLLVKYNRLSVI